ncbi:MAG: hypothetical protein K2P99_01375, partial [Burkholderiales bacterium]|nr:hypothetical protein [Burkholderiales bacterium]
MLTYTRNYILKRKDRPWLLFILTLIWVLGTVFFHSPWEPYEPFVFAVVKGIIYNNSWLVPYVSNAPYLEIQPFYFWIYASIIKLFNITDINYIANTIRILNTLVIFSVLVVVGIIGSGLSAFKNGRTVILILISSLGFINTTYQLSPNILILLGLGMYLYALQKHKDLPGISGGILFIGLLFLSINFTCEFVILAIFTLILLPTIDKYWRNKRYLLTCIIGLFLFSIIFYFYCVQLKNVNSDFYQQWQSRYTQLIRRINYNFWVQSLDTIKLLAWYIAPASALALWSIIKRGKKIFADKILQVSIILSFLLFLFTCISGQYPENTIFPIVILFALIASVEVDSIRITVVSLLNSFSVMFFGLLGLTVWILYLMCSFLDNNQLIRFLNSMGQNYKHNFNVWQLLLALLISVIWLIMITRRHIRGREMVTNWASGSTFVVILFLALWLPWFDSVLTFRPIV